MINRLLKLLKWVKEQIIGILAIIVALGVIYIIISSFQYEQEVNKMCRAKIGIGNILKSVKYTRDNHVICNYIAIDKNHQIIGRKQLIIYHHEVKP